MASASVSNASESLSLNSIPTIFSSLPFLWTRGITSSFRKLFSPSHATFSLGLAIMTSCFSSTSWQCRTQHPGNPSGHGTGIMRVDIMVAHKDIEFITFVAIIFLLSYHIELVTNCLFGYGEPCSDEIYSLRAVPRGDDPFFCLPFNSDATFRAVHFSTIGPLGESCLCTAQWALPQFRPCAHRSLPSVCS